MPVVKIIIVDKMKNTNRSRHAYYEQEREREIKTLINLTQKKYIFDVQRIYSINPRFESLTCYCLIQQVTNP